MAALPSHRVRTFLRQEVPRWRAEGILDAAGAETLQQRYGLGERDPAGLAVAALYVLAAAMVGAGVVSLVAWHWDDMPRWSRLALLGLALVGSHLAGFRMWKVTGRQPRLGHALSLLGTLLFGASIALVAQMFQVSGPWWGMFGAWAAGALAAGLLLPSVPALCLATFLALFVWGPGFIADHAGAGDAVAWAAGGAALALAWRFRSRVLFLFAAGGLAVVLAVAVGPHGRGAYSSTPVYIAVLGVAAWCCAIGAQGEEGPLGRFAPAAAWLGRIAVYALGYALSFREWSDDLFRQPLGWSRAWWTCLLPPLAAGIAVLVPAWLRRKGAVHLRWIAALALAFPVALFLAPGRSSALAVAVVANVAVAAVAGARIAHSFSTRARAPFWEGLAVAALLAVSRFFEIEQLLWLKGAGFILCGLLVVGAALLFERTIRVEAPEVQHG